MSNSINITVPLKPMGRPLILRESIATASNDEHVIQVSKAIGSGALIIEVDKEAYANELRPQIGAVVAAHESRDAEVCS